MPLKLFPPREGKSSNYTIRGTYLGQYVNRTAGSPDKATARKALRKIEADIERGAFSSKGKPTFGRAALNYVESGGEDRFIDPLVSHFGMTPLDEIDQEAIVEAARSIYPDGDNATRNRQVYTPISAILKHAGVKFSIQRPKGAQGKRRTRWLWPEQAQAVFKAAEAEEPEFVIFLTMLCYTGLRLEEALELLVDDVRLDERFAFIPDTKNGDPRAVFLPPVIVAALANHPRGLDRPGDRVFRYFKGSQLYKRLKRTFKRAGVTLEPREGFHIFRHTYGTWMTRYAGLDAKGLVDTKTWRDIKSAARYSHSVVSEEAEKASLLPVNGRKKRKRPNR